MLRDFSSYEIEDFAFDETFQHWVLEPDSPHREFWEKYIASHPQQTDKLLAARALVVELKNNPASATDNDLAPVIWRNIQARIIPVRRIGWQPWGRWQVAASVSLLLLLGAGLWWQFNQSTTNPSLVLSKFSTNERLLEEVNRTENTIRIHLHDGTVVSLAKDSRLTYPRTFDGRQRVVYLSGEAFFEVTKNPDQPFLVYANETVTKVLGTSFRIKAYANAPKVVVAVRTGRVSVFARNDFESSPATTQPNGVVLTPNQQAVFSRQEAQLQKTLVEQPVLLATPAEQPSFNFDNTPIGAVFAVLEKAYGVDIVYDETLFASRTLTVSLEDESLYEKLDVICKTVGVSYQIIDTQVIIERKNNGNP
ncbi:FecR family protein [Spirosoma fluviale]|uniref:FecR family protein n=1 Tax=Spirosoma fluviale TaxID=1597977 RepID=A0A286GB00_9BACT|nr:FecR family protein [Spirosoma fluviale]SOD92671.1 FecR family protein [Spirosoma fluviale]